MGPLPTAWDAPEPFPPLVNDLTLKCQRSACLHQGHGTEPPASTPCPVSEDPVLSPLSWGACCSVSRLLRPSPLAVLTQSSG